MRVTLLQIVRRRKPYVSFAVANHRSVRSASWLRTTCSGRMHTKRSALPYLKCSSRRSKFGDGPGHPSAQGTVGVTRLLIPRLSGTEPFILTVPRDCGLASPFCLDTERRHPSGALEGTNLYIPGGTLRFSIHSVVLV